MFNLFFHTLIYSVAAFALWICTPASFVEEAVKYFTITLTDYEND